MRRMITTRVRRNVVGYLALFVALAATSHGAAGLKPGDVRTTALASATGDANDPGAPPDGRGDQPGAPSDGQGDQPGAPSDGQAQPAPPAGSPGPGNIGARARFSSPVVAKHGGWTDISLTGNTWTQGAQDLELLAGTMVIKTPATCTGSLGNALVLSVDGTTTTFAAAPAAPASSKLTVPFVVGTLTEPGRSTQHKLSARFGVSCTKDGEDYTLEDVKVDVLKFH